MNYQVFCTALTLCIILVSGADNAQSETTCHSGEAAARGGQVAYERDTRAAEEVAKQSVDWADVLNKCVCSVTGISNGGLFPSLEGQIEKIKDQICRAAIEQVSKATSSVNKVVSNATNGTAGVGTTLPGSTRAEEFWSSV